jgi:site-specific recombinase XerD
MNLIDEIDVSIDRVCLPCFNANTRRSYTSALSDFREWFVLSQKTELTHQVATEYVQHLFSKGNQVTTVKNRMLALKKLVTSMAAHGSISGGTAYLIASMQISSEKRDRRFDSLSNDNAKILLDAPDTATLKGLRDRAIIAVLLGCGLRREECAKLTIEQFQQSDDKCFMVGVVGKGGSVRDVPVDEWVKCAIDTYTFVGFITTGVLFRSMRRGDKLQGECMTAQAIFDVVKEYASASGIEASPQNLRQTFISLTEQEVTDYKNRVAKLQMEISSLRRALKIKSNLPHDQLEKAIIQFGE